MYLHEAKSKGKAGLCNLNDIFIRHIYQHQLIPPLKLARSHMVSGMRLLLQSGPVFYAGLINEGQRVDVDIKCEQTTCDL